MFNILPLVISDICLIIYTYTKIKMTGGTFMINYDKCWETMSKRGITKYSLIYHYGLSSNLLRRMAHGESITTSTLNELCLILHCGPEDILSYEVTEEEKEMQMQREKKIAEKKKK